ncbi:MAG: hypothetical protein ACRBC3_21260 [Burkholderiaceae bacterium]
MFQADKSARAFYVKTTSDPHSSDRQTIGIYVDVPAGPEAFLAS